MTRLRRSHGGTMRLELIRKAVHVLVGVLIALGISSGVLSVWTLAFLTAMLGIIVLVNARYEQELLTRVLSINRADAAIPGLDLLAYFVGCLIVVAVIGASDAPMGIALAAILILAIGDPLAHLFGTSFGGRVAAVTPMSYRIGFIAGTIGGALAAWIHVGFLPALVASFIAMFVEAGELRIANHHIDDNLTIPLVSALVLWILWSIAIDFGVPMLFPV